MMIHPLVAQLRFARSEFMRCLEGLSDEDAQKRLLPMNCISWMVGHLAVQEQFYWIYLAQGKVVRPELYELTGYGRLPTRTIILPVDILSMSYTDNFNDEN